MRMKRDNAVTKLLEKYGWFCSCWSWANGNGLVFEKKFYDGNTHIRIITLLDGFQIDKIGHCPELPIITYEEMKLFKVISDDFKEDYERAKKRNGK